MATEIASENIERLKCLLYHSQIPQVTVARMTLVRQQYVDLAELVVEYVPECRSKSLALTYLEDSLMRSIQALALEGKPEIIDGAS